MRPKRRGSAPAFRIQVGERSTGDLVIEIMGCLDLYGEEEWREAIQGALQRVVALLQEGNPQGGDHENAVLLDLTQVSMIDSVGLAFLLKVNRWLSGVGATRFVVLEGSYPEKALRLIARSYLMEAVDQSTAPSEERPGRDLILSARIVPCAIPK